MLRPYPLEPPPLLPPLDGPWEGPDAPLLSGRRARVEGTGVQVGTGLGVGEIVVREVTAERRFLALEEPVVLWEWDGPGAVTVEMTLVLPAGDLRYERSEDGTRLWIGATAASRELLIGAIGGTLDASERAGAVRLDARGERRLRLVVVGAEDEEDRERTLRALARKGFAGLQAQRRRHTAQLDGLAVRSRTPDPSRDAALAAEVHRLDASLRQGPGGHFHFLDPLIEGSALVALGIREPVRDALRAPLEDPALLELFATYAAWSGIDEFVVRHWPRVEARMRQDLDPRRARALLPVAEGVGGHGAVTACAALAGEGEAPAVPVPPALEALWGIAPEGIDAAITLAPELPDGWPEMTLERLRIGGSTLDVKVRRRPAGLAVKCRLTHGPAVVVRLAPRLVTPASGILLHDEQVPGPGLTHHLTDEFEAVWLT